MRRTLVVTGASGYIGRHLVERALHEGWHVVAASRSLPDARAHTWLRYRLEEDLDESAWPNDATIVHLAADTAGANAADVEIEAAGRLLKCARRNGGRVVFVSSQTARPDAPTRYGRTKAAIEAAVLAAGGVAVRPGLVYGGVPGGVYATLLSLVRRRRIVPMFEPAPRVQPIHVDDVVQALLAVASDERFAGRVLRIASTQPIGFDAFLRTVASARDWRGPVVVPLPRVLLPIAMRSLRLLGATGVADRLASLHALPTMDTRGDLAELGIAERPLDAGLRPRTGGRRALVAEGRTMLRYILGSDAPVAAVRRYVRHVETSAHALPVGLPAFVLTAPWLLRAIDQRGWLRSQPLLDSRLDAACAIAEATPAGAARFIGSRRARGLIAMMAHVGTAAVAEAAARFAGAPVRASVRRPDARR